MTLSCTKFCGDPGPPCHPQPRINTKTTDNLYVLHCFRVIALKSGSKYILVLFPTWEDLPIYCFITYTLCLNLCLNVISTESALLRPSTVLISLLHLSTTYICFWSVFVFWFCCYLFSLITRI